MKIGGVVPRAKWILAWALPAIIMLGLFQIGYPLETRKVLVKEWKAGHLAGDYWTQLRLYFSKQEDELLYYEYASLIAGDGTPSKTHYERAVHLYHPVAVGIRALPYRDFHAEYPPLAFLPLFAPRLVASSPAGYRIGFAVEMTCWLYLAIGLAISIRRRGGDVTCGTSIAAYAGMMALLIGPLLTQRFDIVPATMMLACCWAFSRGHYTAAGGLAGLGGAMKIVPLLLLPIPCYLAWRRDGVRAAFRVGAAALAGLAVCLPVYWMAPDGFLAMFRHHTDRGLQIESIYALGLLVAHWFEWIYVQTTSAGNSDVLFDLDGIAALLQRASLPLMALSLVGILSQLSRRREPGHSPLWIGTAIGLVAVFIAMSPIASPQFVIWCFPLVLALPGPAGRYARLAFAVYAVATQIEYNGAYHLLRKLQPAGIACLSLRWLAFFAFGWVVVSSIIRYQVPHAARLSTWSS